VPFEGFSVLQPLQIEWPQFNKKISLENKGSGASLISDYAVYFFAKAEEFFSVLKAATFQEKEKFIYRFSRNQHVLILQSFCGKIKNIWASRREPEPAMQLLGEMNEELQDPGIDELRRLSRLRKEAPEEGALGIAVFLSFLEPARLQEENNFDQYLEYVAEFLRRKGGKNPLISREAFQFAAEQEKSFLTFVCQHQQSSLEEKKEALTALVEETLRKVQNLENNRSYLHFGKIPKAHISASSPLVQKLLSSLPPQFSEWMNKDSPELVQKIKDCVLEEMRKNGSLKIGEAMMEALREGSPTFFYEKLISSLEDDLKELFLEGSWKGRKGLLQNQKLPDALDSLAIDWVEQTKIALQDLAGKFASEMVKDLPSPLLSAACLFGLDLRVQERFWIEITRRQDKYTLRLFSSDPSEEIHPEMSSGVQEGRHLPLIFREIPLEKFDADFFYRLFAYQLPSSWHGIDHSLSDVHAWLLGILEKKEAEEPVRSTVYDSSYELNQHKSSWLRAYLYHHLHLAPAEFSQLFDFELPLEMLTQIWPHIHENPKLLIEHPDLRKELKKLIFHLSEKALALYESKKIELDELKIISATFWEAEETLKKIEIASERKPTFGETAPLIPIELQEWMRFFLAEMGVSTFHTEGAKALLMELLGEDFEEIFDLFFEEIKQSIPQEAEPCVSTSKILLEERFTLAYLLRQVFALVPQRISLLHLFKTLSAFANLLGYAFELRAWTQFLELSIFSHFPLAAGFLTTRELAFLTVFLGPWVIEKIVPETVLSATSEALLPLQASFALVKDVGNYLVERVSLKAMRFAIDQTVSQKQITRLKDELKKFHSQLKREGGLDFHFERKVSQAAREESRLEEFKPAAANVVLKNPSTSQPMLDEGHEVKPKTRPREIKLDPEMVLEELKNWQEVAQSFSKDQHLEKIFYLNQQIRNLPIPIGKLREFWKLCKNKMEILERLHIILCELYQTTSLSPVNSSEENIVSVYALYAIIDDLAKDIESAHIPRDTMKANGRHLIYWLQGAEHVLSSRRTFEQLKELAEYFEVDLGKKYLWTGKDYYREGKDLQIEKGLSYQKNRFSLLEPGGRRSHIFYNSLSCEPSYFPTYGYYKSLLQDWKILDRLAAYHGVTKETSEYEKLKLLFLDAPFRLTPLYTERRKMELDADRQNQQRKEEEWIEAEARLLSDSPQSTLDKRLGLLPRPFYLFRLAHTLAEAEVEKYFSITYGTPIYSLIDPMREGLVLEERKEEELTNFWDFLGSRMDEIINQSLPYFLSTFPFHSNIPAIHFSHSPNLYDLRSRVHKHSGMDEFSNTFFQLLDLGSHWDETGRDSSYHCRQSIPLEQRKIQPFSRLQSEIVLHPADFFWNPPFPNSLSAEERRILEMIKLDPHDQIFRTLDFFAGSKDRLKDPWFRFLFQSLLLQIPSLHQQLQRRPKIAKDIGRYLVKMVQYFSAKNEWTVSLFLTDIGQKLLIHCEMYDRQPHLAEFFPKMSDLVHDQIVPFYRLKKPSQRIMIGTTLNGLLAGYHALASTYLYLDPALAEPEHKKEIMRDIALLGYSQIVDLKPKENWNIKAKGLLAFYRWKPDIDRAIEQDFAFRNDLLDRLVLDVLDLPSKRENFLKLHDEVWTGHFPDYQKGLLSIHLEGETLKRKPKKHRFNHQVLFPLKPIRNPPEPRHLELSQVQHRLALLSWFQPLSTIKIYPSMQKEGWIDTIEFSALGLCFKVDQDKAFDVSGKTPGFFIARVQKHPKLLRLGPYLLLENDYKEQKIHLVAHSEQILLSMLFLKRSIQISSSAALEKLILQGMQEKAHRPRFFTYSLTSDGELESADLESLAYLALFFLVQGDEEKSFAYFQKIQTEGLLHPFCQSVLDRLDQFLLPLFFSHTPLAEKYLLQLSAIREENGHLHQLEERDPSSFLGFLSYVSLQAKYRSYLEKIDQGIYPYLSSHDELFLLQSLSRKALNFFKSSLSVKYRQSKWMQTLGIERMASRLFMLPKIAERYQFLRSIYEKDESWSSLAESLLLDRLIPTPSSCSNSLQDQKEASIYIRKKSMSRSLLSVYHQMKKGGISFVVPEGTLSFAPRDLETISLDFLDLTPAYLARHFLSFYRFAKKELPEEWKEDAEKKEFFALRAKRVAQILPQLRGSIQSSPQDFLFVILLAIANSSYPETFTPASELEKLNAEYEEELAQNQDQGKKEMQKKLCFSSKLSALSSQAQMVLAAGGIQDYIISWGQEQIKEISTPQGMWSWAKWGASQLSSARRLQMVYSLSSSLWQVGSAMWRKTGKRALLVKQKKDLEQSLAFGSMMQSIEPAYLKEMQKRESSITQSMKSFLILYFEREEVPSSLKHLGQVEFFNSLEKEPGIERAFSLLNQSLKDFYERPVASEYRYVLKNGFSFKSLKEDLLALEQEIGEHLKEAQKKIETFVNEDRRAPKTEEEKVIARLKKGEDPRRFVSFDEISRAFIRQDEPFFARLTDLKTPELLAKLKQKLYLHYIEASRWNFFFCRIKDPKIAGNVHALGSELDRERVYGFDQTPEKLVLGKLIFEFKTGNLLWVKQVLQLDRLLSSSEPSKVMELIMASGKTYYGGPEADFILADGIYFPLNIWPAPLVNTNIKTAGKQAQQIFDQEARALRITRSTAWNLEKARGLRQVIDKARAQKGQFNMSKETLQALELSFLEYALDKDYIFSKKMGMSEWQQTINELRASLRLIRLHGVSYVDEAHAAFEPHKELNFPLGKSKTLPVEYRRVMEEVLLQLFDSEEFTSILTVRAEAQNKLDESSFREKIAPILAEKVVRLDLLNVTEKDRPEVLNYLLGKASTVPSSVINGQKTEIALAKGMITILLPMALNSLINVDFDVSALGKEEQARPSSGNKNPEEDSIIQSSFEAFVKTAMLLMRNRLTRSQQNKLIQKFQTKAKHRVFGSSSSRNFVAYDDLLPDERKELKKSAEAKFFAQYCPDHNLFDLEEGKEELSFYAAINRSNRLVLHYLTWILASEIRYFPQKLSSNSSNFASMTAKTLGVTGSPYNSGVYLEGTELILDPGTDGETADLLLNPQKISVQILEKNDPQKALEEVIETCFEKDRNIRALIDRGALFNGVAALDVARTLMGYVKVKKRTDIDGVAFYLHRELVILEKDASDPVPIGQSKISPNRRLSYFPQAQTYGADIPQTENAIGVVTLGDDLPFYELAQAMWRMRGLTKGQKIHFVMTKQVEEKIKKASFPTPIRISGREILSFALKNQGKKLPRDNYDGDVQKMQNILRRYILDKVLFAPQLGPAIDLIKASEDIFCQSVQDDPFELFGLLDKWTAPSNIFDQVRKDLQHRAEKSSAFSEEELASFQEELEANGRGIYPELTHTYQSETRLETSRLQDLHKSSQVQDAAQLQGHEEVNQQVELDMQLEINLHVEDQKEPTGPPQVFCPWPASLSPSKLDTWFEPTDPSLSQEFSLRELSAGYLSSKIEATRNEQKPPHLFSLRDALSRFGRYVPESIASTLSTAIYTTNNVTYLISPNGHPIAPFGPGHIPILQALLIKKGDEPIKIVLLDQKEARYWEEKLQEDQERPFRREDEIDLTVRFALYDLGTRIVREEGFGGFPLKELKQRTLAQLLFLSGRVSFDPDLQIPLKNWLKRDIPAFAAYAKYISKTRGREPLEGSPLETILFELESEQENASKKPQLIRA